MTAFQEQAVCPFVMDKKHKIDHPNWLPSNVEAALVRYRDTRPAATTVKRDLELPDAKFISAVIGPRRAGKTTYMLLLREQIPLPASNKILINGEDVNLEGIAADRLDKARNCPSLRKQE